MADDLRVEQVVTDSTEFIEFEGDCAYCLKLSQKNLLRFVAAGWLTYAHSTEYIFPHISCYR